MEFITYMIDFIMHIDRHLAEMILNYGLWTYLILFLIIFCETGLVVTPFLPGDSLLFVIGALGATGALDFKAVAVLLIIAAVTGNTVNYFIGRMIGHSLFESHKFRFINRLIKKEYLEKAHAFYERHGGGAIFLSRFMPILRTFAPFVAGVSKMNFIKFSLYNAIGGICWTLLCMSGGFFFGGIPAVKNNFTYVIFGIVFISILPAMITWLNSKRKPGKVILSDD